MPNRSQYSTNVLTEELKRNQTVIEKELRKNVNYFSVLEISESSGVKAVFSVVKSRLMRPELYRTWLKGLYKVKLIELEETNDSFEWKFPIKLTKLKTAKIVKDTIINAVVTQQEELESFL
ncbi:MAG: hypothetical protein ACXAEU_04680 [Candidatus Hodarchaeales archaeon]